MDAVESFVRKAHAAVNAIVRLWYSLQRHWVVLVIVAGCSVVVTSLYWRLMSFPGEAIRRFYEHSGAKRMQAAWGCLDESLSRMRWGDVTTFERDYASTTSHRVDRLSRIDIQPWQLWEACVRGTAVYEVDVQAEDRFTKEVLELPGQAINERWLRLRHPNSDVDAIKAGGLSSDGQLSLSLKRRFLLEVEVKFVDAMWRVSNFRWRQVAIVWRSDR
mgnify:CR=1 FL=1